MIEFLDFPFIQRALVSGLLIGTTTAFLGTFVILRGMSFFSDAIAHAALAGVAIGLLLNISPFISAIVFCCLLALGIVALKNKSLASIDTVIGVIFAGSVALGVVIISFLSGYRTDLFTLLFGDILAVTVNDIYLSLAIAAIILIFLFRFTRELLLSTFSQEFAEVAQVKTKRLEYWFFLITALTIALSFKIIGIVLITGFLIIPAAAAKNIASSFRQMVGLAILISLISTITGIVFSFYFDIPSGPAIILVGTGIYLISLFFSKK
ncbi:MAG: metal ABC transporter permease [bacterium]